MSTVAPNPDLTHAEVLALDDVSQLTAVTAERLLKLYRERSSPQKVLATTTHEYPRGNVRRVDAQVSMVHGDLLQLDRAGRILKNDKIVMVPIVPWSIDPVRWDPEVYRTLTQFLTLELLRPLLITEDYNLARLLAAAATQHRSKEKIGEIAKESEVVRIGVPAEEVPEIKDLAAKVWPLKPPIPALHIYAWTGYQHVQSVLGPGWFLTTDPATTGRLFTTRPVLTLAAQAGEIWGALSGADGMGIREGAVTRITDLH
jgi:hypothetical protein